MSQNKDLEFLRCNSNQIHSLNLEPNKNLKQLICNHNQLTELNLNDGIVRVTGKGDKTRLVPMGEEAMDYIQRYLSSARENILKNKKSKYLFVTHHGQSMTRQTFWHSIKKYSIIANIKQSISPLLLNYSKFQIS